MSLPLILVGAGGMGRTWLKAIQEEPEAEVAGIADLNRATAQRLAAEAGIPSTPTGEDAVDLARKTGARAVINVTIPEAHHPVTTAALFAGLPVLGEKPVAANLAQALSLAAAAEVTGELFMVSQSRRYNRHLETFTAQAKDLGTPGILVTEFFKAPRFGGFREEMPHPLLVDMAIHPFDTARYMLESDPVSVYCEEFNPGWSWYNGAAAASAIFEMDRGVRFVYTGSWCSPGRETSWNGQWRLSAEKGSLLWDGEHSPLLEDDGVQAGAGQPGAPENIGPGESVSGALSEFLHAVESGETPRGEVHQNVMSLAMVEAAVESAARRERVLIDDVLQSAHQAALAEEVRSDVAQRLSQWESVRSALLASNPRGGRERV